MKIVISNSITLYFQDFWKIILLSLITYVPMLFLHAIIVNYIYFTSSFSEIPYLAGDVTNGILMITLLTIAQVPFIKYTLLDMNGEENPFRKSIFFAMDRVIPLYIFASVYSIFIFLGSLAFLLPGIIILLLFYFVPFFISDNTKSFKVAIKKSVKFIKQNFFKVTIVIFLLMMIQLFFEYILMFSLSFYTNVYFTILVLKILLLMFLLPLQTIIITNVYNELKTE